MTNPAEVALIVGAGPGISASCARLFAANGMQVALAARKPDKPALMALREEIGAQVYAIDAGLPADIDWLFAEVEKDLGRPALVVHNIDGRMEGIFRQPIDVVDRNLVHDVLMNAAYSAFLTGQAAAKSMLDGPVPENGHRGTIIVTNASAAMKGYPESGAFAMSCFAKRGLAESLARELGPKGIHVAHAPIDAAIGWTREDGTRRHRRAGEDRDDNLADPDEIAAMYLHLHRQKRSTWTFEAVMRPWSERW